MPEHGGTPFRQTFLSRNGAPVNIVYHSRNADTAAFRQISSYYKKVTLYTKFGQLVRRKIIEIVATRCHILRLKCTKFDFRFGVEYSRYSSYSEQPYLSESATFKRAKNSFNLPSDLFTRDSICYSAYMLSPVRLSVRRVDHRKTVEVGIMKFSPYGSPIPLHRVPKNM